MGSDIGGVGPSPLFENKGPTPVRGLHETDLVAQIKELLSDLDEEYADQGTVNTEKAYKLRELLERLKGAPGITDQEKKAIDTLSRELVANPPGMVSDASYLIYNLLDRLEPI